MGFPAGSGEFFAVDTGPEMGWEVPAVDYGTLQDPGEVAAQDEAARLFANDISNHHAGLREAPGRIILPCVEGQPVPLELASASSGLVRVVLDTKTVIYKADGSEWEGAPRLGQDYPDYAATLNAMNTDALYSGPRARVLYRGYGDDSEMTVVERRVLYGHARSNNDHLAAVSSGFVERATELTMELLPGDMIAGQPYEQRTPGVLTKRHTRIAGAVILARGKVPTPRRGD